MAESIREQLLAAVQTGLATINAVAPYQSNLVGKVYRDGQAAVNVDEDITVIIVDRGESLRRHLRLVHENTMLVELQLVANNGDPAQLNKLLARLKADVETKVAATETWGGLAVRTFITDSRGAPGEATSPLGAFICSLEILYRVSLTDPYSAGSI